MRSILSAAAMFAALVVAGPAQAQYGNTGLSLSVGYFGVSEARTYAVDYGIPIGLEGTRYIEGGFETYLRGQAMLLREKVTGSFLIGLAPSLGIRYLFSEEFVRPYVGVDISYFHVFGGPSQLVVNRVGPGANVGIEFFVTDTVTLGARAQGALYVTLNEAPFWSFGGNVVAATYF